MEWKKVDKDLPQSDTFILVMLFEKVIATAYYYEDSFGKWFSPARSIWDRTYTSQVTHWMELPKFKRKDIIQAN